MTEPSPIRHGLSIGTLEFRRTVRAIWRDKARVALMALSLMVPMVIATVIAVAFADAIRGVEALPAPDQIRGSIALSWLFGAFLVGQRVLTMRTRIDAEPFVLTSASARTTAGGLLVAETLRGLVFLVPLALLVTGVCVLLIGSPAGLVTVPTAALLFVATAVVAGSACGYAGAWLLATSPFVARHKTALGSLGVMLGFGGYILFFYPQVGGVDQSSLAWLPIGWLVDLAVAGSTLATSPLRSVGALLGSAAVLLGGGVAVDRLTSALWFTDPVSVDADGDARSASDEGAAAVRRGALERAVAPLSVPRALPTPTRRVAEWALLRTRRDPNRLLFLMVPLIAVGSTVVNLAIQSGSIDTAAAPLCAVALPWIVGSLFAMNPLGDEGAVLPVTLTAVSGRQYVRGLLVPGLTFGLPLVAVVTAVATLVSPYALPVRVGLVASSLFLACVAIALAPAIGMTFPRFSAITAGQSRDVIPPRMIAVAVHAVLTVVPGVVLVGLVVTPEATRTALAGAFGFAPAVSLELLASVTVDAVAIPADWFDALGDGVRGLNLAHLRLGGGGLVLAGGVLVAVSSYRYAVGRLERYTPS